MFGQRFQHLFPSPGLKIDSLKQFGFNEVNSQRKNIHINKESLGRPPLDYQQARKISRDSYKAFSRNCNMFSHTISSLQKIRRCLTPSSNEYKPNQAKKRLKKQGEKYEGVRSSEYKKCLKVDLYTKIVLFKTECEVTPMIFIKGKVDIFTEKQGEGGVLVIHKLNNYTDMAYDGLSCRIVATEKFIKKNEVNLFPSDYDIVMAGFIQAEINPRSSNKNIEVKGKWMESSQNLLHLTLILRDEKANKILFTTSCFSFQQIINNSVKREQANLRVY